MQRGAVKEFIKGELRSAAFWWVIGLPSVLAGFYIAVAWLTEQSGPLIVLGAVATFAVAMVAVAARNANAYYIGRSSDGGAPSSGGVSKASTSLSLEPRFVGERLIVSITNLGERASYAAQVLDVLILNNAVAFPISVRWQGHPAEARLFATHQTHVLELLEAPQHKHPTEGILLGTPHLLALNGETVRLDPRFSNGDLNIYLQLINIDSSESTDHRLRVHLRADSKFGPQRNVCYIRTE